MMYFMIDTQSISLNRNPEIVNRLMTVSTILTGIPLILLFDFSLVFLLQCLFYTILSTIGTLYRFTVQFYFQKTIIYPPEA